MPWGDTAAWFYDPDGNEFFLNEDSEVVGTPVPHTLDSRPAAPVWT